MTWYQARNKISFDGQNSTVESLAERGLNLFGDVAGKTLAVVSDDQSVLLSAVLAAPDLDLQLLVGSPARFAGETETRIRESTDAVYADEQFLPTGRDASKVETPGLLLLTSGTTGPPKLIRHDYDTINTYPGVTVAPERWLCMYEPGTYAWFQVTMLGLVVSGQTLVYPAGTSISDAYGVMLSGQVSAVPSTPSMWRYLLATTPETELAALPITRISLGGERADQSILDALSRLYPGATLTHLFASTETGAAIVVSDRKAGFPSSWLDKPLHGGTVTLRVDDGTLWIKSAYGHLGAPEWIDTGDAVEIEGDRVMFRGRRGERTINVGGTAVASATLEDLVAAHRGVIWVRASGKPDRFLGNLVALDVVVDRDLHPDLDAAEVEIAALCRDRLPPAYEPRWITFRDEPELGANQKTAQQSTTVELSP